MSNTLSKMRLKSVPALLLILPLLVLAGCLRMEVKPIHITMDVNIKIDRELDSFFNDLDTKPAATAPVKEESK